MLQKFFKHIQLKSPWDDMDDNNIFTKKRNKGILGFDPNNFQFQFNDKILYLLSLAVILLWLASGFYKLDEGEESIILRFGQYNRTGSPGLNYHLPAPFETVLVEQVNKSRRIEIGYRSSGRVNGRANSVSTVDVSNESRMLTGDESIVELYVDVTYHISDLTKYLFNVANQEETAKSISESAIRDVIGNTSITSVLSDKKQIIADNIESVIQKVLDLYGAGIAIEQVQLLKAEPPQEVIEAYRDVQMAKADKNNVINQSLAYYNDIIPKARGGAVKVIEAAKGYSAEVISRSKGDTERFNSLLKQYVVNPNIMKKRLYLETAETILMDANKIFVAKDGILPHIAIGNGNNLLSGNAK